MRNISNLLLDAVKSDTKKSDGKAKSIWATLHERPTKKETNRIENLQLILTTGVISSYLALPKGSQQSLAFIQQPLAVLSIFSFIFLTVKLVIISANPYFENKLLERMDYVVLPFIFAPVFLIFSLIIIQQILYNTTTISHGLLNRIVEGLIAVIETRIFLLLYAVASVVTSLGYTVKSAKTMPALQSRIPEIDLLFTSGDEGDLLQLTIKNGENKTVSPSEIEISIDTTQGVNASILDARKVSDKENTWQPYLPIQPNGKTRVDIEFTRPGSKEEIDQEEAYITVRYNGAIQQEHTVNLRG